MMLFNLLYFDACYVAQHVSIARLCMIASNVAEGCMYSGN